MDQIVQLAGAVAVLAAFVLAQVGYLGPRSRAYLSLNLAGSATMAIVAAGGAQWGFLLLEGCWAIVSAAALGRTILSNREADVSAQGRIWR